MMYENIWERAVLKGRAKNVLSATYWKILAASVIVSFFSSFHFNFYRNLTADYYNSSAGLSSEALKQITAVFLTAVMIAAVFSFIFKIFVYNPIRVGYSRYLFKNSHSEERISMIFSSFNRYEYLKAVKTMFVCDIIIIAGTVLAVIPGIVFSYMLAEVPFIIAENPGIGTKRALRLSIDMTNGSKLDMLVLDLSFAGWLFLGAMLCGIGVIFVVPYIDATQAELYGALRLNAAGKGICSADEIGAEYFDSF